MNKNKIKIIATICLALAVFFVLQISIGTFILQSILFKQDYLSINTIVTRVKEDIVYTNGAWNMGKYNSDPQLPDTSPVYIITTNGFVLDRLKPVKGFLDTADYSELLSYETPSTITTPGNQQWRVLSTPVKDKGNIIGVITVGYFDPAEHTESDSSLTDATGYIKSHLNVSGGSIDASNLDPRNIKYDIAFEVVNNYNQIIINNYNTNSIDRIPNYIDRSYIGQILNAPAVQTVQDTLSHESFLLVSSPLYDQNHNVAGILVVGKSIEYTYTVLRNYVITEIAICLFLIGILTLIFNKFLPKLALFLRDNYSMIAKPVSTIKFDKKNSLITINDKEIQIPFATNQYYLCKLLFSNPAKNFENDEILEAFGDDFGGGNSRKVYDTMLAVNKKLMPYLNDKFILVDEKTYHVNPSIRKFIA